VGYRGFTTRLTGAECYMAPELFSYGFEDTDDDTDDQYIHLLTTKSDVYAFAMTGLEVRSRQVPLVLLVLLTLIHCRFFLGNPRSGISQTAW
jgi:hypothetical protein